MLTLIFTGCETTGAAIDKLITALDMAYIENTLEKIELGMSKEEVVAVINQDYSDGIMRMSWYPPHVRIESRVTAYFYQNKLTKIIWLKFSGFMSYATIYEKK